ncbi:CPBP family intramembrane glutamic endopeptidase [Sediminibacterium soli]|uniref:CPBP family intramembrane glutamic endopeptidase n=1 Tax=Sediminibacterium soli TaxID=2698829 RepID=UPI00137AE3E4|nr:CPBP family intramembrane glutamic endopeptidase [Sediminibacterium soli]NCI47666.1 CPBP family intramembrane metalloprotease [Sediminibacterium soli]
MNQKTPLSYFLQFAILLGLFGCFLVIGNMLAAVMSSIILQKPLLDAVNALSNPVNANVARLLNTVAAFISFFVPAVLFAMIIGRKPFTYLQFSKKISGKQVMLIFIITIGSMVLSGALGELNEKIPLPADLYEKARKMEELYKKAMLAMASMHSVSDYLMALAVIAAAPALFEEVFFRGTLQQLMVGWTKNKWAGIIVTSILFSAFHFSYFGFLPRLALGIVLGLIFHNSRNIWLNIVLHFLNNAIVVTQLYAVSRQGKSIEKTLDESMPMWWGLIAVILLVIAFRPFNKECKRVAAAAVRTDSLPDKPVN